MNNNKYYLLEILLFIAFTSSVAYAMPNDEKTCTLISKVRQVASKAKKAGMEEKQLVNSLMETRPVGQRPLFERLVHLGYMVDVSSNDKYLSIFNSCMKDQLHEEHPGGQTIPGQNAGHSAKPDAKKVNTDCPERAQYYQEHYEKYHQAKDLVCYNRALKGELSGLQSYDCSQSAQYYQTAYEHDNRASDLVCYKEALRRELK